ncbi:hypothetical protein [Caballeronia cordobensis]|uniref:FDXHR family putative zinc-binding protein n=1 Tax=Caballeronia cordobensis TaxID=1353886 RepID=UPI00045F083E|nr:putative membrane protein [Burkholderia sp. RPE67]
MLTIEQAREMRQGISLSGDRNQCAECGELFNSVTAFDKHRTGTIGVCEGVDARRCMSLSEMRMLGMVKNPAGFWIKASMSEEARESLRESVTIPLEAAADPSKVLGQP